MKKKIEPVPEIKKNFFDKPYRLIIGLVTAGALVFGSVILYDHHHKKTSLTYMDHLFYESGIKNLEFEKNSVKFSFKRLDKDSRWVDEGYVITIKKNRNEISIHDVFRYENKGFDGWDRIVYDKKKTINYHELSDEEKGIIKAKYREAISFAIPYLENLKKLKDLEKEKSLLEDKLNFEKSLIEKRKELDSIISEF